MNVILKCITGRGYTTGQLYSEYVKRNIKFRGYTFKN